LNGVIPDDVKMESHDALVLLKTKGAIAKKVARRTPENKEQHLRRRPENKEQHLRV